MSVNPFKSVSVIDPIKSLTRSIMELSDDFRAFRYTKMLLLAYMTEPGQPHVIFTDEFTMRVDSMISQMRSDYSIDDFLKKVDDIVGDICLIIKRHGQERALEFCQKVELDLLFQEIAAKRKIIHSRESECNALIDILIDSGARVSRLDEFLQGSTT